MKTFQVNKNIEVVCDWKKTRNGFKHVATLIYDGNDVESVKCNYLNRTWESYEYESVLKKLAIESKVLTKNEKKVLHNFIGKPKRIEDELAPLKNVANVMALGEVFASNQKDKNDWKIRMLKAGLDGKGLIMPDDWDTLDENEKERRLNGIIKHFKEGD